MRRNLLATIGLLGALSGISLGRQAYAKAAASEVVLPSGDPDQVRGLRLIGNVPYAVRERISIASGHIASRDQLAAIQAALTDAMHRRGYLEAVVSVSASAALDGGKYVTIRVEAGPVYRYGMIDLTGLTGGTSGGVGASFGGEPQALTTLSVGEIADAERVERNRAMIEQLLTRRAGSTLLVTAQMVTHTTERTVAVRFAVTSTPAPKAKPASKAVGASKASLVGRAPT